MDALMRHSEASDKGASGVHGQGLTASPSRRNFSAAMTTERFTSFAAFWPYYLREHARPATRALHYIGTSLLFVVMGFALFTGRWWLFALLPFVGYGFAWVAHFAVEKNRPATFTYPLWSLAGDFKMWGLWLTGRLGPELDRAGVR